jgi:hypothetical protein
MVTDMDRKPWADAARGWLIVCGVFAVPALGIGIVVATDDPPAQPHVAPAPAPLPAPTTPPTPTVPVPPLDSPEACAWGAPPQPGLMAECERRRLDSITREALRDTERYRGLRPGGGGGPSWTPRAPSSPRPIQPYPALPGDPNDRDHDGRACESGCIN